MPCLYAMSVLLIARCDLPINKVETDIDYTGMA